MIDGTSALVCACGDQTISSAVILMNHSYLCELGSFTEIWSLPIRLDFLSSEPLESSCPHLPNAEIKVSQHHPSFLCDYEESNSQPHTSLLNEPSPSLVNSFSAMGFYDFIHNSTPFFYTSDLDSGFSGRWLHWRYCN